MAGEEALAHSSLKVNYFLLKAPLGCCLLFNGWMQKMQCREGSRGFRLLSVLSGCTVVLKQDIREIKHHVYGKRERQNTTWAWVSRHFSRLPFAVCRLPFAVFSVKRPVLAFINNAVFRSATIISLCLSPGMFYLFSTQTDRAAGIRESELMFGCHLRRRYQPFYKKALKLCRTSRHPKENTFNGN